MTKATVTRSIARAVGLHNEFDDHKFINSNESAIAQLLAKAAKTGEYKNLALTEDEDDTLKVNRVTFKTIMNDTQECAAVFPRATLFADRIKELEEAKPIEMLTIESVAKVLSDLRRELGRMAELKPMRDGDDSVERTKEAMAKVLARREIPTTNPQGVLAIAVWSRIDPSSPVADKLAERALTRALEALADAEVREEYNLLAFAVTTVASRKQANLQQAEMERRRAALNPGLRKAGFFERIGRSVARGAGFGDNVREPASWGKKNGFHETVREAAAGAGE